MSETEEPSVLRLNDNLHLVVPYNYLDAQMFDLIRKGMIEEIGPMIRKILGPAEYDQSLGAARISKTALADFIASYVKDTVEANMHNTIEAAVQKARASLERTVESTAKKVFERRTAEVIEKEVSKLVKSEFKFTIEGMLVKSDKHGLRTKVTSDE